MSALIIAVGAASISAGLFAWALAPDVGFAAGNRSSIAEKARARLLEKKPIFQVLFPLVEVLSFHNGRLELGSRREALARLQTRAGEPLGTTPDEFIGLCELAAVGGLLLGLWMSRQLSGTASLGAALPFALLGGALPLLWLSEQANRRVQRINRQLPYSLDLLTLSLEAGSDFNGALERLVARQDPAEPLTRELEIVLREVAMGRTRREALAALQARVQSDYITDLVQAVNQATEMGTSLSEVLLVQAQSLRLKRSQRAEKLAGEAPVKMMVPLVFIMGAVLLTVFGALIIKAVNGQLV